MATQKDVTAQINQLGNVVAKIGNETSALQQKVKDLQDAAANQDNASPELVAAVEAVAAQLKVVDDLVPDASELPPPTNV